MMSDFRFSCRAISSLVTGISSSNLVHSLQRLELTYFDIVREVVAVLPHLENLEALTLFECDLTLTDIETISNVCCMRKWKARHRSEWS